MIVKFEVLMMEILIEEIEIGIVVFVKMDGDGWKKEVEEGIKEKFEKYKKDDNNKIKKEIDKFKSNIEWCGVDGNE